MAHRIDQPADAELSGARGRYGRSRRNLAEAAIRCFEERGFSDTTVGEVARAAGYSERTFFRQFRTKEDVVFFDIPDILLPVMALPSPEMSFAAVFRAVGAAMVAGAHGWESAGPDLAERRTRMIHGEPALYRRLVEISTEWELAIAAVFASARGEPVDEDLFSQVLAGAVVAGCRSSMKVWLTRPGTSLAGNTQETLDLIASGFAHLLSEA